VKVIEIQPELQYAVTKHQLTRFQWNHPWTQ